MVPEVCAVMERGGIGGCSIETSGIDACGARWWWFSELHCRKKGLREQQSWANGFTMDGFLFSSI